MYDISRTRALPSKSILWVNQESCIFAIGHLSTYEIFQNFSNSCKSWTWLSKNSLTWFLTAFLTSVSLVYLDSGCSQKDWKGKFHSPKGYSILSQRCLKNLTHSSLKGEKKNFKKFFWSCFALLLMHRLHLSKDAIRRLVAAFSSSLCWS